MLPCGEGSLLLWRGSRPFPTVEDGVWLLFRVSLDVATNSYPRCGAETNSMKAIEMCGLPSEEWLHAACRERWGRVATRGGMQGRTVAASCSTCLHKAVQARAARLCARYAQVGSSELVS